MCEHHFRKDEILWTSSVFDEKTGKVLSCKLRKPKLLPQAIPSQFPNCPKYISQSCLSVRPSRDDILKKKKEKQLAEAFSQSMVAYNQQKENDKCTTVSDIMHKLKTNNTWKILKTATGVCQVVESDNIGPQIQAALKSSEDMMMDVFVDSVNLTELGEHKFPLKIGLISKIEQICHLVESVSNRESTSDATQNVDCISTIKLVISLLRQFKCESFKYCTIISFICLQLDLMAKKNIVYPHDFLVFSSLFHNLSPHAYRFLRNSGTCIFPCYSTIRKVTLASAVSPQNEQNEVNFLFYVRQKYKTLLSCDKTVMLLLDEIHLKPHVM